MFPRDNIGRNTVKNAWGKDDYLLEADQSMGKAALTIIENDPGFPSLARVKGVFRKLQQKTAVGQDDCKTCDNSGWDNGQRWAASTGGLVMVMPRQIMKDLGHDYTYVTKCACERIT